MQAELGCEGGKRLPEMTKERLDEIISEIPPPNFHDNLMGYADVRVKKLKGGVWGYKLGEAVKITADDSEEEVNEKIGRVMKKVQNTWERSMETDIAPCVRPMMIVYYSRRISSWKRSDSLMFFCALEIEYHNVGDVLCQE